jgi:hypothetical protein
VTWNSRADITGAFEVVDTVTPLEGTVAAVLWRLAVQKNAPPAVDTGVMRTRWMPAVPAFAAAEPVSAGQSLA